MANTTGNFGSSLSVYGLTLWEPYASAVALGAKRIETRTWKAPQVLWNSLLVIHSSRHWNGTQRKLTRDLVKDGLLPETIWENIEHRRGECLSATTVYQCVRMQMEDGKLVGVAGKFLEEHCGRAEMRLGNYSESHSAWMLRPPVPLVGPLPARGVPGLWEIIGAQRGKILNQIGVDRLRELGLKA